jgi:hypothetical protein
MLLSGLRESYHPKPELPFQVVLLSQKTGMLAHTVLPPACFLTISLKIAWAWGVHRFFMKSNGISIP